MVLVTDHQKPRSWAHQAHEPDGSDSIRLRFENVPFDELIAWLADLQATQAVGVASASADPGQDAGRLGANLQLSRAAARTSP